MKKHPTIPKTNAQEKRTADLLHPFTNALTLCLHCCLKLKASLGGKLLPGTSAALLQRLLLKKKKVKTIMGGCFCCRLLSDCCCALKFVYCASFCCRELTCTRMQGSCPASDDRFGRKPGREVICKSFRPLYAYVASYLLPL